MPHLLQKFPFSGVLHCGHRMIVGCAVTLILTAAACHNLHRICLPPAASHSVRRKQKKEQLAWAGCLTIRLGAGGLQRVQLQVQLRLLLTDRSHMSAPEYIISTQHPGKYYATPWQTLIGITLGGFTRFCRLRVKGLHLGLGLLFLGNKAIHQDPATGAAAAGACIHPHCHQS